MPIINIQRRMAEQGRIRLGVKAPVGTSGKTRPAKLSTFRFTSPNAGLIAAIAEQYGGTARPWDNGGKPEHEVITDATSVPVIVTKGGLSQWMETWSGGGCVHRCDGERNVLTDEPCDPRDPNHVNAKPTTRLSVMLTEIETLGVWRMESHGWNAAAEIPAMAELAMHVGDLVPANLHLIERRAIRDGKTSRFVVPVLDLQVTKARLVELVGGVGGQPALDAPAQERPAIEAPRPDYAAIADTMLDVDSVRDLWKQAAEAGHLDEDLKDTLLERVRALTPAAPVDEPVDAEVVEDAPADPEADRMAVWQQLLAAAGAKGASQSDVTQDVEFITSKLLHECTAEDLRGVLATYATGEVA
ncbi:hypothetical protein [Ornithinimicrobium cerasi]|uniref:recombination directionality factor n=1 Tax=Ornithinimicrobium cerasi TaxID=2248773 RepID=UPI000F00AFD2|nr:hypothetical protein [Ornithinimicrobium cerasi]